jgi:hypothetical protein
VVVRLHLRLAVAKQAQLRPDLRRPRPPARLSSSYLRKVAGQAGSREAWRGGEAHFDLSVVHRKRLLGPFFARSIARNTTAWVANSQEIEGDLERWGCGWCARVHAIPNGVEDSAR